MKIDFDKIEQVSIPNFKGGEKSFDVKMFTAAGCKILKGELQSGASIGMHTHSTDCEIMRIEQGSGVVIFDGEEIPLQAGDIHYCPKGHTHSLINTGEAPLSFLGIVPEQ